MTDVVGICNMALANVGSYVPIQSLQEKSKEARACAQFYDHCLDMMLRDYTWSFTLRRVELADLGNPPPGWSWKYQYPADAVFIQKLGSFNLNSRKDDLARHHGMFMIVATESGKAILSNMEDATCVYSAKPENPNAYPAHFVDALSWLLSSRIAMGLTGEMGMVSNATSMFRMSWDKAVSQDLQESSEPEQPEAESIRVRHLSGDHDCGGLYRG